MMNISILTIVVKIYKLVTFVIPINRSLTFCNQGGCRTVSNTLSLSTRLVPHHVKSRHVNFTWNGRLSRISRDHEMNWREITWISREMNDFGHHEITWCKISWYLEALMFTANHSTVDWFRNAEWGFFGKWQTFLWWIVETVIRMSPKINPVS